MFCPECKTCDGEGTVMPEQVNCHGASEDGSCCNFDCVNCNPAGDGVRPEPCTDCHGTGKINRWKEATGHEYDRAFMAGGGQLLTVLSAYTCNEGDAFTHGRKIITTWGTREGEPVVHHEVTNHDPHAPRNTDTVRFWVWR